MKQKIYHLYHHVLAFCQLHIKLLFLVCAAAVVSLLLIVVACSLIVGVNSKYILKPADTTHIPVGLVLGSGITKDGKPYKELQARLDVAADSLQAGVVDTLILSGDNRFNGYNEPDAMKDYLVQVKHIPADKLAPDYAGRSTYESCERAAKIFSLKEVLIFSSKSHLPRAIYLCRHFGITAYGKSSGVEANNSGRREPLARVKAVFNVNIVGENTVLGPPIAL